METGTNSSNPTIAHVPLRPAQEVMRLERMGSFFPTRLSFLRSLLRKMAEDQVVVKRTVFNLDDSGFGDAVYEVVFDGLSYSMIAYSMPLDPESRTDRVIATAWDACFVLFDGRPTADDLAEIKTHAIKQEAGRYDSRVLVLSRANKSVRLFDHVVGKLSTGEQPDAEMIGTIGYLMRTTAVYGNGKFGMADRADFVDRPSLSQPFRLEMLTVYLIREFTLDLIDHVAKRRGGTKAIKLNDGFRRQLGIGNSTGLGMAPFLVGHPVLINNWMVARETALARVRSLDETSSEALAKFNSLIPQVTQHLHEWNVDDEQDQARIEALRESWAKFCLKLPELLTQPSPWNAVVVATDNSSVDLQELLVALVLEPHGDLIDDLCEYMEDSNGSTLDPSITVATFSEQLKTNYGWALEEDLSRAEASAMVWYVSEEKAEPRLGERPANSSERQEMPHHVPHKVQRLSDALAEFTPEQPLAMVLAQHPEYRDIVRRVQTTARHPYAEIQDNLVAKGVRPIDLLRCKLSFFGASKFDPRSDRWTRITLYQGAPTARDLDPNNASDVFLPCFEGADS